MDTLISETPPPVRRGRPVASLSPDEYNHARLLERFKQSRGVDIRALCKENGVSHQQFYDIVYGRIRASEEKILAVADVLGVAHEEICPTK